MASQVSKKWHDFIAGERSLWIKLFKSHRIKNESDFNQNITDLSTEQWKEVFGKFEEMATFDEIFELNRFQIKVANPDWICWPHVIDP